MGKPSITLYYDIVSPFGYMAFYMLRHSSVFKSCDINYVPIFLGGIMKATGNNPPLMVTNKKDWINVERRRWATLYNIPMPHDPPEGFPVLTLTIQRALSALSLIAPDQIPAATDALYKKYWVERNVEKVDKPEGLTKLLSNVLGKEIGERVVKEAGGAEAKGLLNKRGEEALAEGAFGVPFMVVLDGTGKKESFWGFDHLGQVTHFLGLEKPTATGGWQAML